MGGKEVSGYPGAKGGAGVAQRIVGQMPPHGLYVEAFLGSGVVFTQKTKAHVNILLDLDPACLAPFARYLQTETVCTDAVAWLRTVELGPDCLVYADPPYLLETRKNRRYYKHEMTDLDHAALLEVLCGLKCYVMLSGYPSPMYATALAGWRCITYRTRTRGRTVTECLWCNFPEPKLLHDPRFAGRNCRERLTLKRLAARYLARLQGMPPRKRQYVMAAIRGAGL